MTTTRQEAAQPTPSVGDVVRVRKGTFSGLIEGDYVDDLMVSGRIPYASTYDPNGQYAGSYRGTQSAWLTEVVEVTRRSQS